MRVRGSGSRWGERGGGDGDDGGYWGFCFRKLDPSFERVFG